ncbi:hypothetical protein ACQQ2N_18460 [Dokdonella sp. MW10]|uniref:hypothetical protein n=1 Tax=Dokdonella sp. MW10 TaxID=2992926 RepID=UPI003F81D7FB
MADEILRADARLRRTTIIVLACAAILLAASLVAFHRWFAAASATDAIPMLILRVRTLTGITLTAVAVCLAALAWHAARSARRTRTTGRWPPLGARVVRDTPILVGGDAARRARLLDVTAILLALLAAGVAALGMQLLALLG